MANAWEAWEHAESGALMLVGDTCVVSLDLVGGHTETKAYPFDSESAFGVVQGRVDAIHLAYSAGYVMAEAVRLEPSGPAVDAAHADRFVNEV